MVSPTPARRQADWWTDVFQPFRTLGSRVQDFFSPEAEAGATDTDYEIKIELPGVKEEDIDISLDNRLLTIKGEKHSEREEKDKDKSYYFSERMYGSFQRSFQLPGDVKPADIKASFKDGVLEIKLPKLQELPSSAKKISIGKK
ncbi:molecular chaperone Hsp20 [Sneathiella chinensis]|uniref:Molecular chaperone Hsp20 n=2 Tax=Sneathiella chinensis TaxID=349750 RepID=A0ABQ5U3T2_9PROT|nr:molecular chaperone Hsp20 [Sneathiella chinensis]